MAKVCFVVHGMRSAERVVAAAIFSPGTFFFITIFNLSIIGEKAVNQALPALMRSHWSFNLSETETASLHVCK